MAMPSTDSDELAKFGYKQELDRSLGLFSSFAARFSYISIMTGVFELFFFGFALGRARVHLDLARRARRADAGRTVLRRACRAVPAGRVRLPVVKQLWPCACWDRPS